MSQYQTIKTSAGMALEAAADTEGAAITLSALSVGDGNGQPVQPSEAQTGLVHEVARVPLSSLYRSETDAAQWTAEGNFPAGLGGWTVREVGLWTASGVLFAVGAIPDLYKPAPSELAAGELLVAMSFATRNSDNVTIEIDGSVEMASRDWVVKQINAERSEMRAITPPPAHYLTGTYDDVDATFFAREQASIATKLSAQLSWAASQQQQARFTQRMIVEAKKAGLYK